MFSDYKGVKLDLSNRKIFEKSPKYLKIKGHTSK